MLDKHGQHNAEQPREELGLWLQRRLGERCAHVVWIAAVVALTAYVGAVVWLRFVPMFGAMVIGPLTIGPAFAGLLTVVAPWIITSMFVPDTEPWARGVRRVGRILNNIEGMIDDGLAILVAFAVCLMLAQLVLGPNANALAVLGLGGAAMVAVVVGWRWSAASRAHTLRPSTALTVGAVALLALGGLYLASQGQL